MAMEIFLSDFQFFCTDKLVEEGGFSIFQSDVISFTGQKQYNFQDIASFGDAPNGTPYRNKCGVRILT
ncbi:hypothetical protein HNR39_001063 [Glaciimonas immobilis]|uniref:Uncharacterized protein n=1 Tax=Glaciimonas immobilis TaxID=728004 RepID=A0A840RQG0_9BURK|nr:hypothetical protein [Glaciimonas immobilis]